MIAIEHLLQQPAAQAIGWALLQFVSQGALVGLLSAAALFALRRSAADVRYVVGLDRSVADAHDAGGHGTSGVALDDGDHRPGRFRVDLVGSGAVERSWRDCRATGPDRGSSGRTACRREPTVRRPRTAV